MGAEDQKSDQGGEKRGAAENIHDTIWSKRSWKQKAVQRLDADE